MSLGQRAAFAYWLRHTIGMVAAEYTMIDDQNASLILRSPRQQPAKCSRTQRMALVLSGRSSSSLSLPSRPVLVCYLLRPSSPHADGGPEIIGVVASWYLSVVSGVPLVCDLELARGKWLGKCKTWCCGSSPLERSTSVVGDPIMRRPAGITTISGQVAQSRNTSPGAKVVGCAVDTIWSLSRRPHAFASMLCAALGAPCRGDCNLKDLSLVPSE
jgi:hypothetical protein